MSRAALECVSCHWCAPSQTATDKKNVVPIAMLLSTGKVRTRRVRAGIHLNRTRAVTLQSISWHTHTLTPFVCSLHEPQHWVRWVRSPSYVSWCGNWRLVPCRSSPEPVYVSAPGGGGAAPPPPPGHDIGCSPRGITWKTHNRQYTRSVDRTLDKPSEASANK
jgi:hypothetical protein